MCVRNHAHGSILCHFASNVLSVRTGVKQFVYTNLFITAVSIPERRSRVTLIPDRPEE